MFPDYVETRTVVCEPGWGNPRGGQYNVRAVIRADRELVWYATGEALVPVVAEPYGLDFGALTAEVPVTDQEGWFDPKAKAIIDVSADGAYSHRYTATVEYIDGDGKAVHTEKVPAFVVPPGVTPLNLRTAVELPATPGDQVLFPDWFRELTARAERAAEVVETAGFLLDQRGTVTGTLDLSDVTTNAYVHATLTGDVTVTLPTSPIPGRILTLVIAQDATGGHSVTIPDALAAYGVLPVPAADPNAVSEWHVVFDGVDWKVRVAGTNDLTPTEWSV